MKAVLKQIDIYGYAYAHPVDGKSSYKTIHGGLFSFISGLVFFSVLYIFGQDFFHKTNPTSFKQLTKVNLNDPLEIDLTNDNFIVFVKMGYDLSYTIPREEWPFFFRLKHFTYTQTAQKQYKSTKVVEANLKPCSQVIDEVSDVYSGINLEEWDCFDFKELVKKNNGEPVTLGGSWNGTKTVKGLDLVVETCQYDFEAKKHDPASCKSTEYINSMLEKDLFIQFLIPRIEFNVNNYYHSLNTILDFKFYKIYENSGFRKYFFFSFVSLNDDRGWILPDLHYSHGFSFDKENSISNWIDPEDMKDNSNTEFGKVLIYADDFEVIYHRRFVKIQELFANLGGILKLITAAFGAISKLITLNLLKVRMVDEVFFFDNGKLKKKAVELSDRSAESKLSGRSTRNSRSVMHNAGGSNSFFWIVMNGICCAKKEIFKEIYSKSCQIEAEIDLMKQINRACLSSYQDVSNLSKI